MILSSGMRSLLWYYLRVDQIDVLAGGRGRGVGAVRVAFMAQKETPPLVLSAV